MQAFKDFAVQSDWVINMLAAYNSGSEEARAEAVKAVKTPPTVLRIIDQYAREASALPLSAHVQAVGALLKLQQRPFMGAGCGRVASVIRCVEAEMQLRCAHWPMVHRHDSPCVVFGSHGAWVDVRMWGRVNFGSPGLQALVSRHVGVR